MIARAKNQPFALVDLRSVLSAVVIGAALLFPAAASALPNLPSATASAKALSPSSEALEGIADPAGAGPITACRFEYVYLGNEVETVTLSGAAGSGDLSKGSRQITSVTTSTGAFAPGEPIEGAGIPETTTVVAVGASTVTLSKAATASDTAVALSTAPSGGTFTLSDAGLNIDNSSRTTRPFPVDLVSGELDHGFRELANQKELDIVTGAPGGPFQVEFVGRLGTKDVTAPTADNSALSPPGASVLIETTQQGNSSWTSAVSAPCETSPPSSLPYSSPTPTEVHAEAAGLNPATVYHYRLLLENASGPVASAEQTFETLPKAPVLSFESISAVTADTALIHTRINPGGGDTTYHIEYITSEQFERNQQEGMDGFTGAGQSPDLDLGSERFFQSSTAELSALASNTTYRYRAVVDNVSSPSGGTVGPIHAFTTMTFGKDVDDTCSNAHVRQQTAAAGLLDCRAYELVSAAQSGGYDVESTLIPGQSPYAGFPEATGRVLYGVAGGGIPGTDNPTNGGVDPYVATRGTEGWSTAYVGVPANDPFAASPFSSVPSGADSNLETFAFGGPGGCSPCFEGGYTGIPVRLPDGKLVQGMVASGVPQPPSSAQSDGDIAKRLSANGEHFIFGSTALFAEGGNDETGDVSIYDRNLKTGETLAVSNTPEGEDFPEALPCLQGEGRCESGEGDANGIAELDISKDGSHILLGQKVSEDTRGNPYWHLYMDVDDSVRSIDLTPEVIAEPGGLGFSEGVLFDGMTADGSKVFFTTKDALHTAANQDTDASADIYEAKVSGSEATLTRVSTGAGGSGDTDACDPVANSAHQHWNAIGSEKDCGVVAVGGGGGVASGNGAIYFLSPEDLTGLAGCGIPCSAEAPIENAPNLYLAQPGQAPHYVTTLESILTGPQPPEEGRSFLRDFGSFTAATGLAVDHQSGDVYVLDIGANAVEKFDASGNPVDFTAGSGAGTNLLNGADTPAGSFSEFPGFGPNQLVVDQTTGDFYVPDLFNEVVDKFSPTGAFLGSIPAELPTGVAVDQANEHLYVASFLGSAKVFDASGAPVTPTSFSIPAFASASIAVDSSETAYVSSGGTVTVYDASGAPTGTLATGNAQGVAVDSSNGDVYVDEGNQITRFDSSGGKLEAFGADQLSESGGITVDPGGNLYAAKGTDVAAFGPFGLLPDPSVDNPLVLGSVNEPSTRHTADFQLTPNGDFAAFPSTLALADREEETDDNSEIFRYDDVSEGLDCVSCVSTGIASEPARLAADGLSLSDDGRVFFTTKERLVASDTDEKSDAYEWEPKGTGNCEESSQTFRKVTGACLALISAGTSTFDSGLLSASADGKDAFFFTRDSLAPQDENGPTMKVYDARADGGFPYEYPPVACRASDECHGPSSAAPGPLQVGSSTVTPEEVIGCKKGFVKKHGKCVRKPRHKKHRKRAAHNHHGGKK